MAGLVYSCKYKIRYLGPVLEPMNINDSAYLPARARPGRGGEAEGK